MRKKLMGGRYLMLETRKDGTKFTTKGLKEAAERLQGISRSYDQRQHALVEQVQFAAMCSLYALLDERSAAGRHTRAFVALQHRQISCLPQISPSTTG